MQGDKLNFLYFISRGSVEVLRNDVVVAILGKNQRNHTKQDLFYVYETFINVIYYFCPQVLEMYLERTFINIAR